MKIFSTVTCSFILLFSSAVSALAGDLLGTWTEQDNWGTRAGVSEHKLGDGDYFITMEDSVFTLKVTEQSKDKRSFHGEWCSVNMCEDAVGAVMTDGTIFMVDEDGYFQGIQKGNTMELCYMEADSHFRVVNCRIMKRK